MSRGQQGNVIDQTTGQAKSYNQLAQTSFNTAQSDLGNESTGIADYATALGAFKAANPYVQGGQDQTLQNQQLSDTAAGGAESLGQAVQGAAVRTGQNAGGAIAATQDLAAENQRRLAGEEAGATQQRIAAGTGYGEAVLGGTANKQAMQSELARQQASLAGTEGGLSQGALGIEEKAAQTPSFMDELGQGLITAGTNFAGAYGKSKGQGSNQGSNS